MSDIERVLADAPPKPGAPQVYKNRLLIDNEKATPQQLQAELLRLDYQLAKQRHTRNRAEVTYKSKKKADPEFRRKQTEYRRAYRSKASE